MPFVHSTLPAQHDKPAKPYAEFPLFAHAAGVWAKKIHGFLNAKQALVAEGRLSSLTRNDHKTA